MICFAMKAITRYLWHGINPLDILGCQPQTADTSNDQPLAYFSYEARQRKQAS
jgi:hypothetical protein